MRKLTLTLKDSGFNLCQMPPETSIASIWLPASGFWSITHTKEELSIILPADAPTPLGAKIESGWRMLRVNGTLDFSLVGILARLTEILALAGVSIFSISSYNTDYLLVKESQLPAAIHALQTAGVNIMVEESASVEP
ncbi:MAG: ACT domain-containing protein [Anaerolineaceae bacterium]|nr:ACT domain-containing protein [Anaerolineaceae bacterium]